MEGHQRENERRIFICVFFRAPPIKRGLPGAIAQKRVTPSGFDQSQPAQCWPDPNTAVVQTQQFALFPANCAIYPLAFFPASPGRFETTHSCSARGLQGEQRSWLRNRSLVVRSSGVYPRSNRAASYCHLAPLSLYRVSVATRVRLWSHKCHLLQLPTPKTRAGAGIRVAWIALCSSQRENCLFVFLS